MRSARSSTAVLLLVLATLAIIPPISTFCKVISCRFTALAESNAGLRFSRAMPTDVAPLAFRDSTLGPLLPPSTWGNLKQGDRPAVQMVLCLAIDRERWMQYNLQSSGATSRGAPGRFPVSRRAATPSGPGDQASGKPRVDHPCVRRLCSLSKGSYGAGVNPRMRVRRCTLDWECLFCRARTLQIGESCGCEIGLRSHGAVA